MLTKVMLLLASATVLIAGVSIVSAQNHIVSWGDGEAGTHWNIEDQPGTIVILHGDGLNYKFYAEDASQAQNFGIINNITVATGATGDFSLLLQHPSGAPGALHWRAGNLTYLGGTSTLLGINIVGDIRCVSLAARVGGARSPHFTACVDPHELVEG